jgi:hypothetical protein
MRGEIVEPELLPGSFQDRGEGMTELEGSTTPGPLIALGKDCSG